MPAFSTAGLRETPRSAPTASRRLWRAGVALALAAHACILLSLSRSPSRPQKAPLDQIELTLLLDPPDAPTAPAPDAAPATPEPLPPEALALDTTPPRTPPQPDPPQIQPPPPASAEPVPPQPPLSAAVTVEPARTPPDPTPTQRLKALPPPAPRPPPRRPPPPRPQAIIVRPPLEQTAPALPPSAALAPPAPAPTGVPPPPPTRPSPDAIAGWQAGLAAHLARFKHYPAEAQRRGDEGVVLIRVTIARDGQVLEKSIVHSSGFPDLDAEAAAWITRASPLPAMPPGIAAERVNITVPLHFTLK